MATYEPDSSSGDLPARVDVLCEALTDVVGPCLANIAETIFAVLADGDLDDESRRLLSFEARQLQRLAAACADPDPEAVA